MRLHSGKVLKGTASGSNVCFHLSHPPQKEGICLGGIALSLLGSVKWKLWRAEGQFWFATESKR